MMLDFGQTWIGIDPGTRSLGIVILYGGVLWTESVVAKGSDLIGRLRTIASGVRSIFDKVYQSDPEIQITVVVEDGVYRAMPKVCAMLGEVRGVVLAECFRRGWPVRRVAPIAWKKRLLTDAERKMKKDKAYIAYWNRRLELDCRTADEVDAAHLARYGAGLKKGD